MKQSYSQYYYFIISMLILVCHSVNGNIIILPISEQLFSRNSTHCIYALNPLGIISNATIQGFAGTSSNINPISIVSNYGTNYIYRLGGRVTVAVGSLTTVTIVVSDVTGDSATSVYPFSCPNIVSNDTMVTYYPNIYQTSYRDYVTTFLGGTGMDYKVTNWPADSCVVLTNTKPYEFLGTGFFTLTFTLAINNTCVYTPWFTNSFPLVITATSNNLNYIIQVPPFGPQSLNSDAIPSIYISSTTQPFDVNRKTTPYYILRLVNYFPNSYLWSLNSTMGLVERVYGSKTNPTFILTPQIDPYVTSGFYDMALVPRDTYIGFSSSFSYIWNLIPTTSNVVELPNSPMTYTSQLGYMRGTYLNFTNMNQLPSSIQYQFTDTYKTVPIPIGIIYGSLTSYAFSYVGVFSQYSYNTSVSNKADTMAIDKFLINPNPSTRDFASPNIVSFQIEVLAPNLLINICAEDALSGVARIELKYYGLIVLTSNHRVSGNRIDGCYQALVPVPEKPTECYYTLRAYDMTGNKATLYQGDLTTALDRIPSNDPITLDQITSFKFKYLTVDTTNIRVENQLYINLTNPDPLKVLYFGFTSDIYPSKYILDYNIGFWDDRLKLYVFNFTMPMNMMDGEPKYSITSGCGQLYSYMIGAKFAETSRLRVTSAVGDMYPPMVIGVVKFPYSFTIATPEFGWNLTIEDQGNGFSHGEINVTSELDPHPYRVFFTVDDLIEGDNNIGIYQFKFDVPSNCHYQTYTISSIVLYDNGDNWAHTDRSNGLFTPFDKLTTTQWSDLSVKFSSCGTGSSLPPSINGVANVSIVDVGVLYPHVEVNITVVAAIGETISTRNTPFLLVQAYSVIDSDLIVPTTYSGNNVFRGIIKFPYRYGAAETQFLVSAYGGVTKSMGIAGSPILLLNRTFVAEGDPILSSVSTVYNDGSKMVTLTGHRFGPPTTIVQYVLEGRAGDGALMTIPSSQVIRSDHTFIIVNLGSFQVTTLDKAPQNITLSVRTNTTSNSITVPIVINVATGGNGGGDGGGGVSKCPFTPNGFCDGHGLCKGGECICYDSWTGPDCSSSIDNSTTTINNTIPIVISQQSTINSTISVIELQELDISNVIVNRFPLKTWNYYLENRTSEMRLLHQYYLTVVNNNTLNSTTGTKRNVVSTFVNVTIESFDRPYNYSFANDIYYMTPGSIKFSVTLSKYRFKSSLNHLRLVMSTQIDGSEECVLLGTGSTSNSEWIKYRVQDKSMYGKFIKKAIIDYRATSISNVFMKSGVVDGKTVQLIGINIPWYDTIAILDPNFSFLVESNNEEYESGCKESDTASKGLTTQQIIGIVVGAVVFAIFATLITVMLIKRKYKIHFENKKLVLVPLKKLNTTKD